MYFTEGIIYFLGPMLVSLFDLHKSKREIHKWKEQIHKSLEDSHKWRKEICIFFSPSSPSMAPQHAPLLHYEKTKSESGSALAHKDTRTEILGSSTRHYRVFRPLKWRLGGLRPVVRLHGQNKSRKPCKCALSAKADDWPKAPKPPL